MLAGLNKGRRISYKGNDIHQDSLLLFFFVFYSAHRENIREQSLKVSFSLKLGFSTEQPLKQFRDT